MRPTKKFQFRREGNHGGCKVSFYFILDMRLGNMGTDKNIVCIECKVALFKLDPSPYG